MQSVGLQHLFLLSVCLFLCLLTSAESQQVEQLEEEVQNVPVEVITESSPCSATCGLGLRTQTLCLLNDSKAAMEEKLPSGGEAEVTEKCRVRAVQCMDTWQCGLQTMTVTSGLRVEVDCVGDVMEATGRFSWRVSWRYARGIISTDDTLFARWDTPELDRVVLDPVREEDAGTYRCDVQDAAYRRVKRAYWGIRVLPVGVLSLDYDSSLALWDEGEKNQTEEEEEQRKILPFALLALLLWSQMGVSAAVAGVFTALLRGYEAMKRRRRNLKASGSF
ncbi:transmembrane protein 81 isoform X1 [Oreochromis aureus]|uniref:transmembrane protein 81 isoform X1 n=1 Tax=Oreochromis aureus TaxID=47969 RepID=UPI001952C19D|nr:transmembrane protein 81 isoform X1 [Oreochromis aureus]XP_039460969.1 transmembrane protein 81 isoform X1 [Oreochromis aureus]XP_039460970.1 transmembrane protein 81 isoform X1 [Oreochromis aureus]